MNGEPVDIYAKPGIAGSHLPALPATSDDFLGPELGLQWQWNHNPVHGNWSLTKNGLRLQALKARDLLHARNTLTQKIIGQRGTASTELFIGAMKTGQRAGFAFYAPGRRTGSGQSRSRKESICVQSRAEPCFTVQSWQERR